MNKKLMIFILISVCALACQKYDGNSSEISLSKHRDYLYIQDLTKTHFTKEEYRILDKASARFSSYITVDEDNNMSIQGKTAKELNMDIKLFDYFNSILLYWNNGEYVMKTPIMSVLPILRSVTEEGGGGTNTRGGTTIRDAAATMVSNALDSLGYDTAKKYFDMWYFDYRSSDYTMSSAEWGDASTYAENAIGGNYQNAQTEMINGNSYYSNSVSFSNNIDLFIFFLWDGYCFF